MNKPFSQNHPEQMAYNQTCSMWLTEGTNDREKFAYRDGHFAGWRNAMKQLESDGIAIDSAFASRLAFMLECMLVDSHGHWDEAAKLLDEYKAEWERLNPSPPTFMGEPMPAERKAILLERLKNRGDAK